MEALAEGQDFWIPEVSGVIAGVLTLRPNFIDKLFLAPQWQGLGIGSALIAKAKVCATELSRLPFLRVPRLHRPRAPHSYAHGAG